MKKFYFILGILLSISFVTAIIVFKPETTATEVVRSIVNTHQNPSVPPTPTPYPFREMTIPGLRERTYTSTLGELQPAYNGQSFTAYLTSYTSDGLKINALLTKPAGSPPQGGWPAIIFIHGYIPPTQYQTTGQYTAYVNYLAANGFVVFKIDLRGHGTSEGQAGGGYYGSDYVTDALNAYSAMQNADFVNPKRIGLWGHSMAGNIVSRSIAVRTDIPAAVIWAGAVYTYVDLVEYRISDSSYRPPILATELQKRRERINALYGQPSADNFFWKQMAPANYLHEYKGSLEIHHAVNDDVVSIQYSRNLMSILDKTQVSHQLFEYPDGGHNISGISWNIAMQRTADFFKKM